MKICLFTENFYKGGLDTFIINLFNAWPDKEDQLTLVCNDSHPGIETIREKTFEQLNILKYKRFFSTKIATGESSVSIFKNKIVQKVLRLLFIVLQYPVLTPWYVFTLVLFFIRKDFEKLLVINGGYPGSLICRAAVIAWSFSGKKSKAIFNFHNASVAPAWYFKIFENLIDKALVNSSGYIVSVSKNCLETLQNRNGFKGSNKLRFIYNGISDPLRQIELSSVGNSKLYSLPYCLMLATYEKRKGHSFLLNSFKLVVSDFPELTLKIYGYGSGEEKKRVIKEVEKLNLQNNVQINDFIADANSLIANARVLVVPSQEYESFGLTVIEAMSLSVPVVCTNVGGLPEVIRNTNAGFVCDRNNIHQFADAIISILRDSKFATELGRNGRKAFEKQFHARVMAKKYKELFV